MKERIEALVVELYTRYLKAKEAVEKLPPPSDTPTIEGMLAGVNLGTKATTYQTAMFMVKDLLNYVEED